MCVQSQNSGFSFIVCSVFRKYKDVISPLLFAGVLIEGGIVGYDTNTLTGGIGARMLGIGASTEFREDTVAVGLRLISVDTGEILLAISTEKTILSTRLSSTVFKFLDAGTITTNYTTGHRISSFEHCFHSKHILQLLTTKNVDTQG